jgi:hypothetical protein
MQFLLQKWYGWCIIISVEMFKHVVICAFQIHLDLAAAYLLAGFQHALNIHANKPIPQPTK